MRTDKLIQRVLSMYSRGAQSDDSRLTARHVYNALLTNRTFLNEQDLRKHRKLDDKNYHVFDCIKLVKVPYHDCPCLPARGCEVTRSEFQLPDNEKIDWVMTPLHKLISKETRDTYRNVSGNRYTAKNLRYIFENRYLYIYGENIPAIVRVRQYIEDPMDKAIQQNSCEEATESTCAEGDCLECMDLTQTEFPMDEHRLKALIDMTHRELVGMFPQNSQDIYNNTQDEKSPLRVRQQGDGSIQKNSDY